MYTTLKLMIALCVLNQSVFAIMPQNAKIFVAGARGLVGSALVQELQHQGYTNLLTPSSSELDLRDQHAVNNFFAQEKPEYVFVAAAKVGGIGANSWYPADFGYENLIIACNVIHAAYQHQVTKLLYLGSSCIYPRDCPQPIKEEYLLSGYLEETNKPYALAKIAALVLCQAYNTQYGTRFITCMPTNLYGPGDNFHLQNSHVLPALIAKMHQAKMNNQEEVILWGTGMPRREFLHVHDCVQALIYLMNYYDDNETVNIGSGIDCTIKELACLVKEVVGFQGNLVFDSTKPDGTPRKLLDVSRMTQWGWSATISLKEGIESTYQWYLDNM